MPQWHQKGFLTSNSNCLHYLDLAPDQRVLDDGRIVTIKSLRYCSPARCFVERDLYTTFFGEFINDDIEKFLFGEVDDTGSKAVRAYISGDPLQCHNHFSDFFKYLDVQKLRTPKGLDWIKNRYADLDQLALMIEMQSLRHRHCTIWAEGVREIVSAENSNVKFIVSDHPVTIFNPACPPDSEQCAGSNDPAIALKGTQTLFPLDCDHCLILTSLEYAQDPKNAGLLENRTNARTFSNSHVRTDAFIRTRFLTEEEVHQVNRIIKARALRYIAAGAKDWMYPERHVDGTWERLGAVLLPPEDELFAFGGETYIGYKDGTTRYQDAFGRTTGEPKHLLKTPPKGKVGANQPCPCGSGKKFKKCCKDIEPHKRPSWTVRSIRERNLMFYDIVCNILSINAGKTWDDVRAELSNDQVKAIHEAYGALWPIDTVLTELLPRANKRVSRAVYTGIIDPRSITFFATSLILHVDEIIIQNPFINPANMKPDFSPVQSPHQFKQETLKNVLLLIELTPLIELGYVVFVPDPCAFDYHLRSHMMAMAEERSKARKLSDDELEQLQAFRKHEMERTLHIVPERLQRQMILDTMPAMTEKKIDDLVEYLRDKRQQDPLALLQDDLIGDEGQIMIFNLTPNFEMAFYLAQLTGSFLFTDNRYRWNEMLGADRQDSNENWGELERAIEDLEVVVNSNPYFAAQIRVSGQFGTFRAAMRDVLANVQQTTDRSQLATEAESTAAQVERAWQASKREFNSFMDAKLVNQDELGACNFDVRFTVSIPVGGYFVNNVRRLLLSGGIVDFQNSVPMIVFLDIAEPKAQEA